MLKGPKQFKPRKFKDASEAYNAVCEIYEENTSYLYSVFEAFTKGEMPSKRVSVCYPYIKINVEQLERQDSRLSYGFVAKPGEYLTTITRPSDIFNDYLKEQIKLLLTNHSCGVEVGVSDTPIPLHFALGDDYHLEADLSKEQIEELPNLFDQPDLSLMDDQIANGTFRVKEGEPAPLSLFTAPRIDLSLQRLRHYTGTSADHFQNYVIYTNYQFYIDEFIKICQSIMVSSDNAEIRKQNSEYVSFVEPGNKITANRNLSEIIEADTEGNSSHRLPQMPAYHLKRKDRSGITMVNIGVGPSNAKTITDHVAVLRPHAWLMLGHCAGLRNSQMLGDYVLAHGYLREDNVLYKDVHPSIPIPSLAEIQQALEEAVGKITGEKGYDVKKVMRTGTVATVDDRNWELRSSIRKDPLLEIIFAYLKVEQ
jgi:AMP nucleosidase